MSENEGTGHIRVLAAVTGVPDRSGDTIQLGAIRPSARTHVPVLDAHNQNSVRAVLGRVVSFASAPREALPYDVLRQHPHATGGYFAELEIPLTVPEGVALWERIKAGVVEWSVGLLVNRRTGNVVTDAELLELSAVPFGAQYTATLSRHYEAPLSDYARAYQNLRAGLRGHYHLGRYLLAEIVRKQLLLKIEEREHEH